jgi:hypothetical protein
MLFAFVVKRGIQILLIVSADIPEPLSAKRRRTLVPCFLLAIFRAPPFGMASNAFWTMFTRTRAILPLSTLTS